MTSRTVLLGRAGIAATSAAILLVGTGAVLSPASADAPVKVGWWNFASGGGQAVPAPDVNTGGIRIGVVSQQPVAFGAVQYALPKDGSATIELAVTKNTDTQGLNKVMMCPTKDNSWKPGDDQDASGAPSFDCDVHHFVGRLSADGKTMTFLVDGSADVSDGVLSLAVVPLHTTEIPQAGTDPGTGTDLTPPFVMDFDKPGANSFVSDDSSSSSSGSDSSAPPPPAAGPDVPSGGSGGGTTVPAAPATSSSGGGDLNLPPATADAPGASPVVAGAQPPSAVGGQLAPQAAVAPAKPRGSDYKRNLLWLLLIALAFFVLYTQNQTQRAPRVLAGPRTREQGGAAAAALPMPYPASAAPRGLGRFAKPREGAARPLI